MTSSGPYLYDDGPAPLHTAAASRSRRGLVLGIFGGTAVLAVGAALLLPVVTGSPDDQARQVTGVFLAAMSKGDTETTYGLLCDTERTRLGPDQVASAYRGAGDGQVVSATGDRRNGTRVELVDVRWGDGSTAQFTVVNQGGPRVCGTRPLG